MYEQRGSLKQQVIVVDNGLIDGSVDMIRSRSADVELIDAAENLGFARGVNLAATKGNAEFLLLLNPDTVVLDHAIERLVKFARLHSGHGLYGGRTVKRDGTLELLLLLGATYCLEHDLLRSRPVHALSQLPVVRSRIYGRLASRYYSRGGHHYWLPSSGTPRCLAGAPRARRALLHVRRGCRPRIPRSPNWISADHLVRKPVLCTTLERRPPPEPTNCSCFSEVKRRWSATISMVGGKRLVLLELLAGVGLRTLLAQTRPEGQTGRRLTVGLKFGPNAEDWIKGYPDKRPREVGMVTIEEA